LCYTDFEVTGKARYHAIDQSEQDAKTQAVIENLKPACICNKIRKGTVVKAIQSGAKTFEQVSKRTGVGTGPCGGRRCGSLVRGLRRTGNQLQRLRLAGTRRRPLPALRIRPHGRLARGQSAPTC